jgi:hypothetical protein
VLKNGPREALSLNGGTGVRRIFECWKRLKILKILSIVLLILNFRLKDMSEVRIRKIEQLFGDMQPNVVCLAHPADGGQTVWGLTGEGEVCELAKVLPLLCV